IEGCCVAVLLREGADPDVADDAGQRPLHLVLAEAAAATRLRDANLINHTKLGTAKPKQRSGAFVMITERLLRAGADPNAPMGDPAGATPLHLAVQARSRPLVRLLLRFGADPRVKDAAGRTAEEVLGATLRATKDRDEASQLTELVELLDRYTNTANTAAASEAVAKGAATAKQASRRRHGSAATDKMGLGGGSGPKTLRQLYLERFGTTSSEDSEQEEPSQREIAQAYLAALRTGPQPRGTSNVADPAGTADAAAVSGSIRPQHYASTAVSIATPRHSRSQLPPPPPCPTLRKAAGHSLGSRSNLDPDLAATRIQAAFRGHRARRQLTAAAATAARVIRASEPLPSRLNPSVGDYNESSPSASVLNDSGALVPGTTKYGPYNDSHERAAVKIQAAYRRSYTMGKSFASERQRRQPPAAAAAAAVAIHSMALPVLVPVATAVEPPGPPSETLRFNPNAAAADASRLYRPNTATTDNLLYGVRHERAAVRIQAAWKGRQARKLYVWVRQAAEQDDLDLLLDPEEVAALSRNVSLSTRAGGSRRAVRLAEGMPPSGGGDGNAGAVAVVAGMTATEAEAATAAANDDALSDASVAESLAAPEPPLAPEAPVLPPRGANSSLHRSASRTTTAAAAAAVSAAASAVGGLASASRGSFRRSLVPQIGLTEEGRVVGDLGDLDLLELESTSHDSEDGGDHSLPYGIEIQHGGDHGGVFSGFGVVQHSDNDEGDNGLDGAGSEASVF
ncbi:hypothetical protein VaNZ11_002725, partial [Volvox africanus]